MAPEPSLQEMTLRQLRNQAMQLEISRYSRLTKAQLVQAIREARADLFGVSKEVIPDPQEQGKATSAKFHAGGVTDKVRLADVDANLGELPEGYGLSRIVLLPRDPNWAYAYWDISNEHKEACRRQGGSQLALQLIDVTYPDLEGAGNVQEYPCTEVAREWYLPVSVSDRSYVVEIGYRTGTGAWLPLARSAPITIPPSHPSDWIEDQFVSVSFEQPLQGKLVYQLQEPPSESRPPATMDLGREQVWRRLRLGEFSLLDQVPGSIAHLAAAWMASGSGLGLAAEEAQPRVQNQWVIYGQAETDTQIQVGNHSLQLQEDGHFHLAFSLSEGDPELPGVTLSINGQKKSEIYFRSQESP